MFSKEIRYKRDRQPENEGEIKRIKWERHLVSLHRKHVGQVQCFRYVVWLLFYSCTYTTCIAICFGVYMFLAYLCPWIKLIPTLQIFICIAHRGISQQKPCVRKTLLISSSTASKGINDNDGLMAFSVVFYSILFLFACGCVCMCIVQK